MSIEQIKAGEAQTQPFASRGYIIGKLSNEQLQPFIDEMHKIQSDFDSATPYNKGLAGNLQHEYLLEDALNDYTFKLVLPYVQLLNNQYGYLDDINVLDKPCEEMLHSLWINFQKKYEFNPLHNHSGIASFVIWLKVPFDMKDELNNPSTANARMKCPAHFTFVHADSLGGLSQALIPVDRKYEGMICVFPSSLYHQVYPFYTSDDFRVSISGNICLKSGG